MRYKEFISKEIEGNIPDLTIALEHIESVKRGNGFTTIKTLVAVYDVKETYDEVMQRIGAR